MVDVRDVADLHLRAMTDPAASGERFLAASGDSLWLVEIARLLKARMSPAVTRVSTRVLPNWFIRIVALFKPAMRGILSQLGVDMNDSGEKAKRLLGWAPRSREDAIIATAESVVRTEPAENLISRKTVMKILEQCFRVYARADEFESTIAFYEQLQGVTCARRVTIAETNVAAARVGNFLILAGDGEAMTAARHVHGIFYVDDLDAYADWVRAQGGELLHEPRTVTSGRNFTARHPDGLVMEYFSPSP